MHSVASTFDSFICCSVLFRCGLCPVGLYYLLPFWTGESHMLRKDERRNWFSHSDSCGEEHSLTGVCGPLRFALSCGNRRRSKPACCHAVPASPWRLALASTAGLTCRPASPTVWLFPHLVALSAPVNTQLRQRQRQAVLPPYSCANLGEDVWVTFTSVGHKVAVVSASGVIIVLKATLPSGS